MSFVLLLAINALQGWSAGGWRMSVHDCRSVASRHGSELTEPRAVRWAITGVALAFLALFLVCRSSPCSSRRSRKGVDAYRAAIVEPDARGGAAADAADGRGIAVPLQSRVRRLRPDGRSRSSSFRGKQLLIDLIDLPFAVSPVISGHGLRAAVRPAAACSARG